MTDKIHLKGLNGIRAIAAVSVVLLHICLDLHLFGLNPYIIWGKTESNRAAGFRVGDFAVTIFFTLSGFLITYLLLKEQQIREMNIKDFYIRRILRIWPLYFLILFVSLAVYNYIDMPYSKMAILYYIFFIVNIAAYLGQAINLMGFYWSLGIEEQFYLVWPVFIKFSKNNYLKNTLFLLLFFFLIRLFFGFFKLYIPEFEPINRFFVVNRYHTLIIGGIAAMLFFQEHKLFIRVFTNKYLVLLAWITIFLPLIKGFKVSAFHEITAFCTVAIIISQISGKNIWINLENRVMDFLGKISYGMYMTHSLTILLLSKLIGKFANPSVTNYLSVFVSALLATIAVSSILYYGFERWFLNRKKKYEVIKDSGLSKP